MLHRPGLLLVILVLGGAVGGCGGDEESAATRQPSAPQLTVPGEGTPSVARTERRRTSTTETSEETTSTAPAPAPAPAPPAPAPAADSPENDTPPAGGTPAERFEEGFCDANPGECDGGVAAP